MRKIENRFKTGIIKIERGYYRRNVATYSEKPLNHLQTLGSELLKNRL